MPADLSLNISIDAPAAAGARRPTIATIGSSSSGGIGRPVSPTSKRSMGWLSTTFYLRPESRLELQQAAGIIQLAGYPAGWPKDQSEIVQLAVQEWLAKNRSGLARLRAGL